MGGKQKLKYSGTCHLYDDDKDFLCFANMSSRAGGPAPILAPPCLLQVSAYAAPHGKYPQASLLDPEETRNHLHPQDVPMWPSSVEVSVRWRPLRGGAGVTQMSECPLSLVQDSGLLERRGMGPGLPPHPMEEQLSLQQQQMEEDQLWLEQEERLLVMPQAHMHGTACHAPSVLAFIGALLLPSF